MSKYLQAWGLAAWLGGWALASEGASSHITLCKLLANPKAFDGKSVVLTNVTVVSDGFEVVSAHGRKCPNDGAAQVHLDGPNRNAQNLDALQQEIFAAARRGDRLLVLDCRVTAVVEDTKQGVTPVLLHLQDARCVKSTWNGLVKEPAPKSP